MRLAIVVTSLSSLAVALAAGTTLLAVGCSSSSNKAGPADGGGGGDECAPIDSACGQPCQEGNSLGIGKFCNTIDDCKGSQIPTLCATLGDPNEHFCTAMCAPPDASDDAGFPQSCGENATCQCQGGQCGCFPNSCF
jgi:hypothetical protein